MSSYGEIDYESTDSTAYKLRQKTDLTEAWRLEEFNNKKLIPFCNNCFSRAYSKERHTTHREDYAGMALLAEGKPVASFDKYKQKTIEIFREWRCKRCGSGVSQSLTPEEIVLVTTQVKK